MGAVRQETGTDTEQVGGDSGHPRSRRLLGVKLRAPELPSAHVPRPAQCALLSQESTLLTLLSGPPGAGKTTLLAEWFAAQPDERCAWVSVDVLDNDPAHFWTYVVAALQRYEPTVGVEALDLLRDADTGESLTFVESLAADLADLASAITLILDDLHRVEGRPVLRALDYLIEHLPASLRLIVSTRADPPLALHRLRLRGELLELRQSDLQFTKQDAETFFERFGGVRLGQADVRLLTERTEGWIAGLQLAALSLRGEEDPEPFVRRLAVVHPTIADYLLGEVIERQPTHIQEFLLRTSILAELSAPLCDVVSGRTDSHQLLRSLAARNLFIVPADATRDTFRYHHLFAELLQSELRSTNPGAWRKAHQRAAAWYSAAGRPAQAMEHLITGGFHDEAVDLLINSTMGQWDLAQAMNMRLWLDRFPAGFFDSRPKRMLDLATVLTLGGRYAEAARCLEQVETTFMSGAQTDAVQETRLTAVRFLWAIFQGDAALSIDLAERLVDSYRPDADDGYINRFPYALVRSWVWLDDPEAARAALRRAYPFPPVPESIVRFYVPTVLSMVHFLEGHLRDADRFADEALAYVNVAGPDHPDLLEARLTRAGVLWEQNQLDESEREFETALRELESHSQVPGIVIASLGLARIWAVSGRRGEAFELISSCRRANHPRALPAPFAKRVDTTEARLLLAAGETSEARGLIDCMPPSIESSFLRARLALTVGDNKRASELLGRMESLATPRQQLQWWLLDTRSHSPSGRESLRAAVEFAAQERFVRCFVDEGGRLPPLLRQLSIATSTPFVQDLLAAFEAWDGTISTRADNLMDPLSEREEVVLSYLPSWVPNDEIAAELYISLNTLKTHLRSIYRKLGAKSRRQAVTAARSRGLL